MGSPLLELRALLSRKTRTQTVSVIQSTATSVLANTRDGPATFKNDGSLYVAGELLLVRDSTILGRAVKEDALPVYFV